MNKDIRNIAVLVELAALLATAQGCAKFDLNKLTPSTTYTNQYGQEVRLEGPNRENILQLKVYDKSKQYK